MPYWKRRWFCTRCFVGLQFEFITLQNHKGRCGPGQFRSLKSYVLTRRK
ncbi:unnamed protein product [Callosobruchus maculatus]|uniref:Uncharacterized protein n=1 Tax=Callosobruchus maculatus TaxID=64391 RepID=A0A653DUX7_CALMS|nr:unnamed protein product [Callosobruchus maculatus]